MTAAAVAEAKAAMAAEGEEYRQLDTARRGTRISPARQTTPLTLHTDKQAILDFFSKDLLHFAIFFVFLVFLFIFVYFFGKILESFSVFSCWFFIEL